VSGRGRFLVLEGGDATGKSTQVRRLAQRLRDRGRDVVETFEPGATALGAQLRSVLLDGPSTIDPIAEALLMAADRAQHVAEVLRPALDRGAWVVSDRFVPSSLAYQGVARGLGVERIEELNRLAAGGITPDLVVVLEVSTAEAHRRLGTERDRLEGESAAFVTAVHDAYRDLAPDRGWAVVDGEASPDAVADAIWTVVEERCTP